MQLGAVAHLSLVVPGALLDRAGARLGRVDDLIVRAGAEYPPLSGVLAVVAGRRVFVPAEQVAEIGAGGVVLGAPTVDLRPFARREGELLLRADVLDRQLVDLAGARLVRANDIELARTAGWWAVTGVDVGPRGIVRRLRPRRLARRLAPGSFLDWAQIEPLSGSTSALRLRVAQPKLARLHPADLADLVESASPRVGAEIVDALAGDPVLEADDADLLGGVAGDRQEALLGLLPPVQRRRVRMLLGYDPATAGGLMGLDLVAMYPQATRDEAIERVRQSAAPAEALAWASSSTRFRAESAPPRRSRRSRG